MKHIKTYIKIDGNNSMNNSHNLNIHKGKHTYKQLDKSYRKTKLHNKQGLRNNKYTKHKIIRTHKGGKLRLELDYGENTRNLTFTLNNYFDYIKRFKSKTILRFLINSKNSGKFSDSKFYSNIDIGFIKSRLVQATNLIIHFKEYIYSINKTFNEFVEFLLVCEIYNQNINITTKKNILDLLSTEISKNAITNNIFIEYIDTMSLITLPIPMNNLIKTKMSTTTTPITIIDIEKDSFNTVFNAKLDNMMLATVFSIIIKIIYNTVASSKSKKFTDNAITNLKHIITSALGLCNAGTNSDCIESKSSSTSTVNNINSNKTFSDNKQKLILNMNNIFNHIIKNNMTIVAAARAVAVATAYDAVAAAAVPAAAAAAVDDAAVDARAAAPAAVPAINAQVAANHLNTVNNITTLLYVWDIIVFNIADIALLIQDDINTINNYKPFYVYLHIISKMPLLKPTIVASTPPIYSPKFEPLYRQCSFVINNFIKYITFYNKNKNLFIILIILIYIYIIEPGNSKVSNVEWIAFINRIEIIYNTFYGIKKNEQKIGNKELMFKANIEFKEKIRTDNYLTVLYKNFNIPYDNIINFEENKIIAQVFNNLILKDLTVLLIDKPINEKIKEIIENYIKHNNNTCTKLITHLPTSISELIPKTLHTKIDSSKYDWLVSKLTEGNVNVKANLESIIKRNNNVDFIEYINEFNFENFIAFMILPNTIVDPIIIGLIASAEVGGATNDIKQKSLKTILQINNANFTILMKRVNDGGGVNDANIVIRIITGLIEAVGVDGADADIRRDTLKTILQMNVDNFTILMKRVNPVAGGAVVAADANIVILIIEGLINAVSAVDAAASDIKRETLKTILQMNAENFNILMERVNAGVGAAAVIVIRIITELITAVGVIAASDIKRVTLKTILQMNVENFTLLMKRVNPDAVAAVPVAADADIVIQIIIGLINAVGVNDAGAAFAAADADIRRETLQTILQMNAENFTILMRRVNDGIVADAAADADIVIQIIRGLITAVSFNGAHAVAAADAVIRRETLKTILQMNAEIFTILMKRVNDAVAAVPAVDGAAAAAAVIVIQIIRGLINDVGVVAAAVDIRRETLKTILQMNAENFTILMKRVNDAIDAVGGVDVAAAAAADIVIQIISGLINAVGSYNNIRADIKRETLKTILQMNLENFTLLMERVNGAIDAVGGVDVAVAAAAAGIVIRIIRDLINDVSFNGDPAAGAVVAVAPAVADIRRDTLKTILQMNVENFTLLMKRVNPIAGGAGVVLDDADIVIQIIRGLIDAVGVNDAGAAFAAAVADIRREILKTILQMNAENFNILMERVNGADPAVVGAAAAAADIVIQIIRGLITYVGVVAAAADIRRETLKTILQMNAENFNILMKRVNPAAGAVANDDADIVIQIIRGLITAVGDVDAVIRRETLKTILQMNLENFTLLMKRVNPVAGGAVVVDAAAAAVIVIQIIKGLIDAVGKNKKTADIRRKTLQTILQMNAKNFTILMERVNGDDPAVVDVAAAVIVIEIIQGLINAVGFVAAVIKQKTLETILQMNAENFNILMDERVNYVNRDYKSTTADAVIQIITGLIHNAVGVDVAAAVIKQKTLQTILQMNAGNFTILMISSINAGIDAGNKSYNYSKDASEPNNTALLRSIKVVAINTDMVIQIIRGLIDAVGVAHDAAVIKRKTLKIILQMNVVNFTLLMERVNDAVPAVGDDVVAATDAVAVAAANIVIQIIEGLIVAVGGDEHPPNNVTLGHRNTNLHLYLNNNDRLMFYIIDNYTPLNRDNLIVQLRNILDVVDAH